LNSGKEAKLTIPEGKPAGWYRASPRQDRWWDGSQWTAQTRRVKGNAKVGDVWSESAPDLPIVFPTRDIDHTARRVATFFRVLAWVSGGGGLLYAVVVATSSLSSRGYLATLLVIGAAINVALWFFLAYVLELLADIRIRVGTTE
jgi:hypothetical protein